MASLIKRNWKKIVLVALGVIFLLLVNYWQGATDRAIASLMADRVMAQERARAAAIEAKYAALNAAKDQELAALRQGREVLSGQVVAWRKKSEDAQAKVKTLEGCNTLLNECQAKVTSLDADYTTKLTETDALWCSKVALKDAEILEWKGKDTRLTNRMGELTKALVLAQLKAQRKLIIGPQAGYGAGGAYVGFGFTYEIARFKVPGVM